MWWWYKRKKKPVGIKKIIKTFLFSVYLTNNDDENSKFLFLSFFLFMLHSNEEVKTREDNLVHQKKMEEEKECEERIEKNNLFQL